MIASRVIAHRAGAGRAPENTLEALDIAHQQGVKWVEMDTSLLSDGALLVSHDRTVDRCSDGTGVLAEMTLEDASKLDAGAWFSPEFAGARFPSLDRLLLRLEALDMGFNLEVKIHHDHENIAVVSPLLSAIDRCWTRPEKLIVSSFSGAFLDALHAARPELQKGLLSTSLFDGWRQRADALRAVSVHLDWRETRPEHVRDVKDSGRDLYVWTANDPDTLGPLWDAGLDGVITDWPERHL